MDKKGLLREVSETIPPSILGVHALLIGFTFSMSISRYEIRRELVIKEANAIGTTYLRAQTLPAPFNQRATEGLRKYLEHKVQFGQLVYGDDNIKTVLADISDSHNKLWSDAREMTSTYRSPIEALYLDSLNEMIDVHSERMAAIENQLPETVLGLLILTLFVALFSFGFVEGAKKRQGTFWLVTLSILFAVVITLIIDLDRPRRGLIRVSQAPLTDLLKSIPN